MSNHFIDQEDFDNNKINTQVYYGKLESQLEYLKKENSKLLKQQSMYSKLKEENKILTEEIAFLKCKIDYNNETPQKLNKLDVFTLINEVDALKNEIKILNNKLKSERIEYLEQKNIAEKKLNKLQNDLYNERKPPTKQNIIDAYSAEVTMYKNMLHNALSLTIRDNGPLLPHIINTDTVTVYLKELKHFLAGSVEQDLDTHETAQKCSNWVLPSRKHLTVNTKSCVCNYKGNMKCLHYDIMNLAESLELLSVDTRHKLLLRFEDACKANLSSYKVAFLDNPGHLTIKDSPAMLINYISKITIEKEQLMHKLKTANDEIEKLKHNVGLLTDTTVGSQKKNKDIIVKVYTTPRSVSNTSNKTIHNRTIPSSYRESSYSQQNMIKCNVTDNNKMKITSIKNTCNTSKLSETTHSRSAQPVSDTFNKAIHNRSISQPLPVTPSTTVYKRPTCQSVSATPNTSVHSRSTSKPLPITHGTIVHKRTSRPVSDTLGKIIHKRPTCQSISATPNKTIHNRSISPPLSTISSTSVHNQSTYQSVPITPNKTVYNRSISQPLPVTPNKTVHSRSTSKPLPVTPNKTVYKRPTCQSISGTHSTTIYNRSISKPLPVTPNKTVHSQSTSKPLLDTPNKTVHSQSTSKPLPRYT